VHLDKEVLESELGDLPTIGWHRLARHAELKLEGLYHQEQGLRNLQEIDERISSFLAGINSKAGLEQVMDLANKLMVGKEISALNDLRRRLKNTPAQSDT